MSISLQGWDAAFAVDFHVLNAAIAAQHTTPPTFALNAPEDGGSISGTWGPWRLVPGGDGKDVNLQCPILAGTGTPVGEAPIDLTGTALTIQVQLAAVEDAQHNFVDETSAAPAGKNAVVHRVDTRTRDGQPPVTIQALPRGHKLRRFHDLFEDWFNDHIAEFGHVFSAAMLNLTALNPDQQWLKPTHVGYTVVDVPAGAFSPATGVFAILMILNRPAPAGLAHQIDPRVLSDLPPGANSVYIISGEQFVRNVLLHGAVNVVAGATAADFTTEQGNHLQVTNVRELTWSNLKLDDGYTVSPKIPKGGLMMRIVEDKIEVNFNGVHFNAPQYKLVGEDVMSITFIQRSHPYLHRNADGTFGLTASDQAPGTADQFVPDIAQWSFTAALDDAARTFQLAMSWTGVALSILPLGLTVVNGVFKGISGTIRAGATVANAAQKLEIGGQAFLAAEDLTAGLRAASQAMRSAEWSSEFSMRAAQAAKYLDNVNRVKNVVPANIALNVNRVSTIMGIGSAVAGIVYGVSILQDIAAQNDLKHGVPAINGFLKSCLGATRIPGAGAWVPVDMKLAQSWLIYGQLDISPPHPPAP